MLSATVMFGNRAYDWKTMPTWRWFGGMVGDVLAVDADGARGRALEAGDHAQGRRLAAARRAEERHELAALGRQVEAARPRRSRPGTPCGCRLNSRKVMRGAPGRVDGRVIVARRSGRGSGCRARRAAMKIIAIQVRPKLMSETAAGS